MKLYFRAISLALILGILGFSCEDNNTDNPTPEPSGEGIFEFNITTRVDGENFVPGVVYKTPEDRDYVINKLKLYISDITLIDDQGQETVLSEIELFDLTQAGSLKTFHGDGTFKQFDVPAKNYKGVKFGIGVAKRFNHEDPAGFSPEHPLSVFNEMHWNWAAGYRFLVMEGKVDSSVTADGNELAKDFVYHLGLDTLYREITYMAPDQDFSVPTGDELQYVVEIDLNRLFSNGQNSINIVETPKSHSVPPGSEEFILAQKLMENLVGNALFKVPL